MSRLAVATMAALVLCACAGTVPPRYHTLVAPAEATVAAARGDYAIEVLPVSVPEQVDVPQLVLRLGSGEVAPVETRQWAAPLGLEMRAALSARLMARLGTRDVYRLAADPERPVFRIKVVVSRFESALGRYAELDAGWSVRGGDRVLNCSTGARVSVGSTYEDLVAGHQRALDRLADDIGAAVTGLQREGVAACPGPEPSR